MSSSSNRHKTAKRRYQHQITHDGHEHHCGGSLSPERSTKFPSEDYSFEGSNANNLEIIGINNFVHVRCPMASPAACTCGRYSSHIDSMIIAVDGACPGNGSDKAVASGCGVWFGPRDIKEDEDAQQNIRFEVPDHPIYQHTNQRAELHAAIAGLKTAKRFATEGGQWPCNVPTDCPEPCPIKHLVIKSDSAYIVNSMTGAVKKWTQNGWLTAKKTPVKNRDLWEEMISAVDVLGNFGVHVDFWLVPREENQAADYLARKAVGCRLIFTD